MTHVAVCRSTSTNHHYTWCETPPWATHILCSFTTTKKNQDRIPPSQTRADPPCSHLRRGSTSHCDVKNYPRCELCVAHLSRHRRTTTIGTDAKPLSSLQWETTTANQIGATVSHLHREGNPTLDARPPLRIRKCRTRTTAIEIAHRCDDDTTGDEKRRWKTDHRTTSSRATQRKKTDSPWKRKTIHRRTGIRFHGSRRN